MWLKIAQHDTWVEIPLIQLRRVRAYHTRLLDYARKLDRWWEPFSDAALCQVHGHLYAEIGAAFLPAFNPNDLSQSDRHALFITTGLTTYDWLPDQQIPALSKLETLLGFELSPPKPNKRNLPPKATLTTGEHELDTIAQCCLLFEGSAPWIMEHFDLEAVAALCKQCNDLQRGKDALDEKQREIDREWWKRHEPEIDAKLPNLMPLPKGKPTNDQ